jgi:hypothetical protein
MKIYIKLIITDLNTWHNNYLEILPIPAPQSNTVFR